MRLKLASCFLFVLAVVSTLPASAVSRDTFPPGIDLSDGPPQDPAARAALLALLGEPTHAPQGESTCCVEGQQTGCDDSTCEDVVCGIDGWCCDINWDNLCAGEAEVLCSACGGGGNCCNVDSPEGCGDPECWGAVCDIDDFCCTGWDDICASEAIDLCNGCYDAPLTQEIPTASTVGLGVLAGAMLLSGVALLMRRRRRAI